MQKENFEVGQLVQVSYKYIEDGEEIKYWRYGVVVEKFDGRVQIKVENGYRVMWRTSEDETGKEFANNGEVFVRPLFKDGNPAMVKKKLFGGYTIKPLKLVK